MKPITQTTFGRLLCWLGIHALVIGGWWDHGNGSMSTNGGCVRCNRSWGWDS